MTDELIIKALECCADEYIHSCDYCPFEKECNGDNLNLVKYALDLINRQKAEIERLKEEHKKVRAYTQGNGWGFVSFLEFGKNQRAEAVEQLSHKIESRLANNTDISNEQYQSVIFDISEACKEMVGDTE